jgi:hypothetical protein
LEAVSKSADDDVINEKDIQPTSAGSPGRPAGSIHNNINMHAHKIQNPKSN